MPSLPAELGWIDGQARAMAELVTRWAEVNSYSHHLSGLREVAE